jgi:hypothetical protein
MTKAHNTGAAIPHRFPSLFALSFTKVQFPLIGLRVDFIGQTQGLILAHGAENQYGSPVLALHAVALAQRRVITIKVQFSVHGGAAKRRTTSGDRRARDRVMLIQPDVADKRVDAPTAKPQLWHPSSSQLDLDRENQSASCPLNPSGSMRVVDLLLR